MNKPAKKINSTEAQLTKQTSEKTRNFILRKGNNVHIFFKLAYLLDKHGMTQAELVELTGIGKNVISGLVNQRHDVRGNYMYILAIAEAFDISDISEILEIRRN